MNSLRGLTFSAGESMNSLSGLTFSAGESMNSLRGLTFSAGESMNSLRRLAFSAGESFDKLYEYAFAGPRKLTDNNNKDRYENIATPCGAPQRRTFPVSQPRAKKGGHHQ